MKHSHPMILETRPEWGSDTTENRRKIRAHLSRAFGHEAAHDLEDLSRPPELTSGFLSVSHCRGLGGFLFSKTWAGFDVEWTERVTPELAARIGSMEEFAAASDPAALWCAKEAVFKSLRYGNPPHVIMELKIRWLSDGGFELENAAEFGVECGRGWIEKRGNHTLAGFHTSKV